MTHRIILAAALVVALSACVRTLTEVSCVQDPATKDWHCHASGIQPADGEVEAL